MLNFFHLKDWSISRQRKWGVPIPMLHCDKCGIVSVSKADLPITLNHPAYMKCPKCNRDAKRDTESLDTFLQSCWYYYRFISPHSNQMTESYCNNCSL